MNQNDCLTEHVISLTKETKSASSSFISHLLDHMTGGTFRVHLFLIRHGESEANLDLSIIGGQSLPSVLSPLGNQQAILLGKRLKCQNIRFDYVFSSTAIRAQQTAEIALELMGVDRSKLVTSPALLEQSQGSWEGLNRRQCYTDEIIRRMSETNIEFSAPNGESLRTVQKRGIEFLEPVIERAKQESMAQNRDIFIGVFAHANFFRSLLQYFTQCNPKDAWLIGQNNTAITELVFSQLGTALVRVNDSGHLLFAIPETSTT